MPPSITNIPPLTWAADAHSLAYALITVLVEYPNLKRNIWPAPGDKVSGKPKSAHYQDVAYRLLAEYEPYNAFVRTAEGRKAYGTSVGAQLRQMAHKWRDARDALEVTGPGLNHESEIWDDIRGEPLRNIWATVQQTCPYFYALKPLLGERMLVTDHAVNNSIDRVDTSSLTTRRLPASEETGTRAVSVNNDEESNVNLSKETDADIDLGELLDSSLQAPTRPPTPATRPPTPTTRPPTPLLTNRLVRNTTTLGPVGSDVPLRARATKNAQSDFSQLIKNSIDGIISRKRLRDEHKRDTQQLEIKRKFDLEEKRLNMKHEAEIRRKELELRQEVEMRHIALKERKVALQEQEFVLRQSQLTEGSAAPNPSLLDE